MKTDCLLLWTAWLLLIPPRLKQCGFIKQSLIRTIVDARYYVGVNLLNKVPTASGAASYYGALSLTAKGIKRKGLENRQSPAGEMTERGSRLPPGGTKWSR